VVKKEKEQRFLLIKERKEVVLTAIKLRNNNIFLQFKKSKKFFENEIN